MKHNPLNVKYRYSIRYEKSSKELANSHAKPFSTSILII